MKICGFNKTTLLDYPGKVAATIFVGGCNFRCPFCQNSSLVVGTADQPETDREELLAFLKKRKGILEGVCITGGEPTIHPELPELIGEIASLGYPVKLDTNGTSPEMVKELYREGLIQKVAMDIKTCREKYTLVAGLRDAGGFSARKTVPEGMEVSSVRKTMPEGMEVSSVRETMPEEETVHPAGVSGESLTERVFTCAEYLMRCGIDYEFRTTVVKELHCEEDFIRIGRWLAGAKEYYLQAYRDSDGVLQRGFTTCSDEEMKRYQEILQRTIPYVGIRGMDL